MRRVVESGAPIEAISPEYFTERKEGVKPETDIRTDRFDVALNAMNNITLGIRKKREERMNATAGKPESGSEINAQ